MKVRLAVVGVGRMGGVHAANLQKGRVRGATLAGVCDTDPQKRAAWEKRGVPAFATPEALIEGVHPDGVVVAVPHPAHPAMVEAALRLGVPVLCEKPLAPDLPSALHVAQVSRETGVPFYMMYNQRTNPNYRRAKALLASGQLGRIRRVQLTVTHWYRSQAYYDQGGWRASWRGEGGGLLMNQCVHQLDVLQWLVGMPNSVYARTATVNRAITVENDVAAILEYPDFRCVFQASGHELHGVNRLEIACEKGNLTLGKTTMRVVRFAQSEGEVNATTRRGYGSTRATTRVFHYGALRLLREALRHGQQANVLQNFADLLSGRATQPIAAGSEGLQALALINAIYLSAALGRPQTVPPDPAQYGAFYQSKQQEEQQHGGF